MNHLGESRATDFSGLDKSKGKLVSDITGYSTGSSAGGLGAKNPLTRGIRAYGYAGNRTAIKGDHRGHYFQHP